MASNKAKNNNRSHKKFNGGNVAGSAAAYGQAVYGDGADQTAQPNSNLIAAKYVNNCSGGGKNRNNKNNHNNQNKNPFKGGNFMTNLAVPAVLLTANHIYGKKKNAINLIPFAKRPMTMKNKRNSRRRTISRRR